MEKRKREYARIKRNATSALRDEEGRRSEVYKERVKRSVVYT